MQHGAQLGIDCMPRKSCQVSGYFWVAIRHYFAFWFCLENGGVVGRRALISYYQWPSGYKTRDPNGTYGLIQEKDIRIPTDFYLLHGKNIMFLKKYKITFLTTIIYVFKMIA